MRNSCETADLPIAERARSKRRRRYIGDDESNTESDDSDASTRPSNIHVFSASSTLHGFSHIFALHHSSLRRFAWTVAFLTSLTLFLLQSSNRVIYYLDFPHVTRIDEITAGDLNFPGVTICNLNELRFSKLTKNDMFHVGNLLGFLDVNDSLIKPQFYNEIDMLEPSIKARLTAVKERIDDLTNFNSAFIPRGQFNMSEFYSRAGHDIQDMVLECKYRGRICDASWFTERGRREPKPSDFIFFASNSTLHGINYIFTAGRFTFRKALWVIAFTASLFLFLYQAYDRYTYYSSHPHVTKLDEQEATEIDFPALTICNMNSFRLSEVTTDDYYYTGEKIFGIFDSNFSFQLRPYRDNKTWPFVWNKIRPLVKLGANYKPTAKSFNMSEFYDRTGHQVNEMVKSCKYRGRDCRSYRDWTTVFTRYGKCYTFNSGQQYPPLKTLKGGVDNGLEILLDTQQNEYMPVWQETDEISVEAGFKVQLHVQSEPPFIHELGFGISPGFQNLVATQEQRITFLPDPWGSCVQDFDRSQHQHFKNYSISGCRITCETKFVMDNCNCRMVHMPGEAPFCSPEQYKQCADPALDFLVKEDEKICVCETPCEVTRYNLESSALRLPSTQALSYLAYKYKVNEDYVRDNFVKLNIFFEALNYETIEQKVAYEIPGLLGDIGGQMGLFIGASILTILELFNYVYEVVKDKTWGKKLRRARREAAKESLRMELQNQRELNNGYRMVNISEPNEIGYELQENNVNRQVPTGYNNKLSPLRESHHFDDGSDLPPAFQSLPPPPVQYGNSGLAEDRNELHETYFGQQKPETRETSFSYSDIYRPSNGAQWPPRDVSKSQQFNHLPYEPYVPTTAGTMDSRQPGYLGRGRTARNNEVSLTPLSLISPHTSNPSMVTSPVHHHFMDSVDCTTTSIETDIH